MISILLKLKYFNHTDKKFNLDFYEEKPVIGKLFNREVNKLIGNPRDPKEEVQHLKGDTRQVQAALPYN